MNQEYRLDREYSIAEIIQCNLRKWWLALICAAVCAAVLGGYKYKSLKPFIEQSVYENVKQVTATLYVADYSTSASTERANNVIKICLLYTSSHGWIRETTTCCLPRQILCLHSRNARAYICLLYTSIWRGKDRIPF